MAGCCLLICLSPSNQVCERSSPVDLKRVADSPGECRPSGRTTARLHPCSIIGSRLCPGIQLLSWHVIGSQEDVKFCAHTAEGIGYSSIGYSAPGAKNLKVSRASGEKAFAPTRENILAGTYPLISKLHFYTVGDPDGPLKEFIDFVRSKEVRKVIEQSGMIAADSL